MPVFTPLLADAGDIIGLLFVLVFIIGPLVLKGINALGGNVAKKPGQPGRPGGRPGAPPAQNRPLREEVEEFLRRAKANQPAKAKAKAIEPPPRQAEPIARAEVIEAQILDAPRGGSVAEHVQEHLTPNPVAKHTQTLGRELGQADEQLESHLQETFDHQLGQLATPAFHMPEISQGTDADVWQVEDPTLQQSPAGSALAREIADMFRHPPDVRKAIILSEIITPPDHRWQ